MNIRRLNIQDSVVLVIDVQDKLLTKMPDAAALVRETSFLIDVAKVLGVPVLATEQYPKGLGPTHAEIARRLRPNLPAKVTFSCCGAPGLLTEIQASGRPNVILAGMETHVCVMQTALDLLAQGLDVFLPVECLQSRFRIDHDFALRRMENAGVVLTTIEAISFEWVGRADHAQFKTISRMIQDRMAILK